MLRIKSIKLKVHEPESILMDRVIKMLKIKKSEIKSLKISKKSLDSRKAQNLAYIYTVDVECSMEYLYTEHKDVSIVEDYVYEVPKMELKNNRPIVVGSGPGGLLATLILAEAGLKPIMIEQGKDVDARMKDVSHFMKTGELNVDSNIQFGAGGAGTFSDGKLTTGVNDKRREKLMRELVLCGAPEEVKYLARAHIGTDILIDVVREMCSKIIELGGEIRYNTKFIDFKTTDNKVSSIDVQSNDKIETIECEHLVLALGHSARHTFEMLYNNKINMSAKPFSVGVRIEHKQNEVNDCQYGSQACNLDAANYKLSTHLDNGRAVYTFCMCPGGVVVSASSEEGRLVTNGMSYYARDLENSNSALLVSITPDDFNGHENPLGGIKFQRDLEEAAFKLGGSNYNAPIQRVEDFLNNEVTQTSSHINPSYEPGTTYANLHDCLPEFITDALKVGLRDLGDKMSVFKDMDAIMTAVESRSSSPVTIHRDEKHMANIYGIYPCGEGAGFAGGIVSAAIDGIKCAEKVMENI